MKNICLIGILVWGIQAAAMGPSTGGGGFAVSCPSTALDSARVELLDMYEGRSVLNFTMAVASGNLAEDYLAGVKRTYTYQGYPELGNQEHDSALQNLHSFLLSMKFVDSSDQLPQANDVGARAWIPAACDLKQVAFFDDSSGIIWVQKDLWNKMDSANQAALVFHETSYRDLRQLGDSTSDMARHEVSHIMALRGPAPLLQGMLKTSRLFSTKPFLAGKDEISDFYLSTSAIADAKRVQFTQIQGRPQLTAAWVEFNAPDWSTRFGRSSANPDLFGCILTTPGVNAEYTEPLQGTMAEGLSIRLTYRTGEPIVMSLLRAGKTLSQGLVDGGLNCQGESQTDSKRKLAMPIL